MNDNHAVFQSKLAHDIRSNLGVIMGYCAMLADSVADREDCVADVHAIRRAAEELQYVNTQVEDLMRIDGPGWRLVETIFPVRTVLEEVVEPLPVRHPRHTFECSGGDFVAQADSEGLARILTAIASTACRATPSGCHLTLAASSGNDALAVSFVCRDVEEYEQPQLDTALGRLTERMQSMQDIIDFQPCYVETFRRLLDATLVVTPTLTLTVPLAGSGEQAV